MGASQSTPKLGELLASLPKPSKSIHVERMLDGNCDYILHQKRNHLLVGLCSSADDRNPMQNQCMKIGEDDPVSLMSFTESNNTLAYTFEKDTSLIVAKRDTGEIYYHLKTPTYDITRSINPALRKIYKPIGGSLTLELDKLGKLFVEQK
jgi:hypothetical protein